MSTRLNYGKTFLLGFGFFGVSVIWGLYNAFVPIFLSEKFDVAPALIGFFMTLDNIAALFIHRRSAHGPIACELRWVGGFRSSSSARRSPRWRLD